MYSNNDLYNLYNTRSSGEVVAERISFWIRLPSDPGCRDSDGLSNFLPGYALHAITVAL